MFGIEIPHVLSIFPNLLHYGLFGVFLLRISIGILFLRFGILKLYINKERYLLFYKTLFPTIGTSVFAAIAYIELFGAILLIVGLFTQVIALIFGTLMMIATGIKLYKKDSFKNDTSYYLLIALVSFSLLFLGAGAFAIDYPL